MISHPSFIEIDLDQFLSNISAIKEHIGKGLICLAVRANAYGHGIIEMGKAAVLSKIDYLSVSSSEDGKKLRENDVFLPVILVEPFFKEQIPDLFKYNIEPTISSDNQIEEMINFCKKEKRELKVHLKVDIDSKSLECCFKNAKKIWDLVKKQSYLKVVSAYFHFDSIFDKDQKADLEKIKCLEDFFKSLKKENPELIIHIGNSAVFERLSNASYDMAEVGLLAYGYKFYEDGGVFAKIRPCFSVKSKVCIVKDLAEGDCVGFDNNYLAPKKTKIAIIPIGYVDVYRFRLSCMDVLIRAKRFSVIGRISQDLIMVDVGKSKIEIDDEVVLIGRQGNEEIKLEEIANNLQTGIVDVLCGLTDRLLRKIVNRSREKLSFLLNYSTVKK